MTLSSYNYEEIRDMMSLPRLEKQAVEPLTPEVKCALISELGKIMRISRFARHDSLYDASISAKTSDEVGHWGI